MGQQRKPTEGECSGENAGPGTASATERRSSNRFPAKREFVRAAWWGVDGLFRIGLVSLVDVSEAGAALEMADAPSVGAIIRFQCEEAAIFGMGLVRHVGGVSGRFVVGVEFTDDIFWRSAKKKSYLIRGRVGAIKQNLIRSGTAAV